jgi:hypothetical protein
MKLTIAGNVPPETALKLALTLDAAALYYSHLDGKLKCSFCGWDVELHREGIGGKEPHFEHKDDNPKTCVGIQ